MGASDVPRGVAGSSHRFALRPARRSVIWPDRRCGRLVLRHISDYPCSHEHLHAHLVPRLPLLRVPQRESGAGRARVASARNRHPKAPGLPGGLFCLPASAHRAAGERPMITAIRPSVTDAEPGDSSQAHAPGRRQVSGLVLPIRRDYRWSYTHLSMHLPPPLSLLRVRQGESGSSRARVASARDTTRRLPASRGAVLPGSIRHTPQENDR